MIVLPGEYASKTLSLLRGTWPNSFTLLSLVKPTHSTKQCIELKLKRKLLELSRLRERHFFTSTAPNGTLNLLCFGSRGSSCNRSCSIEVLATRWLLASCPSVVYRQQREICGELLPSCCASVPILFPCNHIKMVVPAFGYAIGDVVLLS